MSKRGLTRGTARYRTSDARRKAFTRRVATLVTATLVGAGAMGNAYATESTLFASLRALTSTTAGANDIYQEDAPVDATPALNSADIYQAEVTSADGDGSAEFDPTPPTEPEPGTGAGDEPGLGRDAGDLPKENSENEDGDPTGAGGQDVAGTENDTENDTEDGTEDDDKNGPTDALTPDQTATPNTPATPSTPSASAPPIVRAPAADALPSADFNISGSEPALHDPYYYPPGVAPNTSQTQWLVVWGVAIRMNDVPAGVTFDYEIWADSQSPNSQYVDTSYTAEWSNPDVGYIDTDARGYQYWRFTGTQDDTNTERTYTYGNANLSIWFTPTSNPITAPPVGVSVLEGPNFPANEMAPWTVTGLGIVTPTITPAPIPTITKSNGVTNQNGDAVFTITVTNPSQQQITGVVVTEKPDWGLAGLTWGTAPSGTSVNQSTGVWTIGNLNNGAPRTITVTAPNPSAIISPVPRLTNVATVGAANLPAPNTCATDADSPQCDIGVFDLPAACPAGFKIDDANKAATYGIPISTSDTSNWLVGAESVLDQAIERNASGQALDPAQNINLILCTDITLTTGKTVPAGKTMTITSDQSTGAPWSLIRDAGLTGAVPLFTQPAKLTSMPIQTSLAATNVIFDGNNVAGVTAPGLAIMGGSLTLGGGAIVQNNLNANTTASAASQGGGVFATLNTQITVTDGAQIINNSALWGGGILLNSTAAQPSTLYVSNGALIQGNTAGTNGGGIYAGAGATVTIDNAQIQNNLAAQTATGTGGGIYLAAGTVTTVAGQPPVFNTAVTLQNNAVVSGNRVGILPDGTPALTTASTPTWVTNADGGGIWTGNNASVTVLGGSRVQGNLAGRTGGGILTSGLSNITVANSSVLDNRAGQTQTTSTGGGINLGAGTTNTPSVLALNNAQITNNYVSLDANGSVTWSNTSTVLSGSGGGIATGNMGQVVASNGTSISNNRASANGGGISTGTTALVSLDNSSVTGNLAGQTVSGTGGGINMASPSAATASAVTLVNGAQITGNYVGLLSDGITVAINPSSNAKLTGSGGGIYTGGYTTVTLGAAQTQDPSQITGNKVATNGGGINTGANAAVYLYPGTQVSSNSAGTSGGGILTLASPTITLDGATVTGNLAGQTATGNGGGIIVNAASTQAAPTTINLQNGAAITGNIVAVAADTLAPLTVSGARLTGSGGGIYTNTYANITMTSGSVVSDNKAGTSGGGIYTGANSSVSITDADVRRNLAALSGSGTTNFAGGIFVGTTSAVTLDNARVKYNRSGMLANGDPVLTTAATPTAVPADGGGIAASPAANVTITLLNNSEVSDNSANRHGAGIYHAGGAVANAITITDSAVANNLAGQWLTGSGGGIWLGAGTAANPAGIALANAQISNNNVGLDANGVPTTQANNAALTGEGGGIYAGNFTAITADPLSTISFNKALTNGGGINLGTSNNSATALTSVSISVTDTSVPNALVTNNSAVQGVGGGIRLFANNNIIQGVTVKDNQAGITAAGSGGGIYLSTYTGTNPVPASATITDSLITNNTAGYADPNTPNNSTSDGGGIGGATNTTITLAGATAVTGNKAARNGGGIVGGAGGTVNVTDSSTVGGNVAGSNGGGVFLGAGSNAAPSAISVTTGGAVTGNTAGASGGGLYFGGTYSSATVADGTIAGNQAVTGNGGGIYAVTGYPSLAINGTAKIQNNTALAGDGGGIWVRYASATDNELANLKVAATATFGGNQAQAAYATRNPADDARYTSNILAPSSAWSNGADGSTPLTQGYNNYDIAYSYVLPTCPPGFKVDQYSDPALGISPSTTTTANWLVGSESVLTTALQDAAPNISITLCTDITLTATKTVATGKAVTITSDGKNAADPTGAGRWSLIRSTSLIGDTALFAVPKAPASLTATNVIFDGNQANVSGVTRAAITVDGGTLTLGGGAVVQNNNNSTPVPASITTSTVNGGGVTATTSSTVNINGGIIQNNTGLVGGGISIIGGVNAAATVNMTSGLITNNSTTASSTTVATNGGGIYVYGNSATLNITGGSITHNTSTTGSGGGIYIASGINTGPSSLNISNAVISQNRAGAPTDTANRNGGGIYVGVYVGTTTAPVTISNTEISGNINNGGATSSGGGLYFSTAGTANITNTRIVGNNASYGAGVHLASKNIVNFYDSFVDDNTVHYSGGGISIDGSNANSATITLANTSVSRNSTGNDGTSHFGGGIWVNSATVTLTIQNNSKINDNTAYLRGGGIYTSTNAIVTIDNSDISGNTQTYQSTGYGGGGLYFGTTTSPIQITSSTINNNTAGGNGGGIWTSAGTQSTPTTLIITDTPITLNNAIATTTGTGSGGGIYCAAYIKLTLQGTTAVTNNQAINGGGIWLQQNTTVQQISASVNDNLAITGAGYYLAQGTSTAINLSNGAKLNGNIANDSGGGMYLATSGGTTSARTTIYVADSQVNNNRAGYQPDGLTFSTLTNSDGSADGGGIWAGSFVTTTLSGTTTVQGNKAQRRGGGIAVGTDAIFQMSGSAQLTDNEAGNTSQGQGGGLFTLARANATLTGGQVLRNKAGDSGGGLYLNANSSLALSQGATVSQNTAGGYGGGILVGGSITGFTMTDSFVQNNVAGLSVDSSAGGGIYLDLDAVNAITTLPTFIFDNAQLTGNTIGYTADRTAQTTISWGGGLYSTAPANYIFRNNTLISDNWASAGGGGVYLSAGSNVTKPISVSFDTGTQITQNLAVGSAGGGLDFSLPGTSSVSISGGVQISTNGAGSSGGGIWFEGMNNGASPSLTISDSTISDNESGQIVGGSSGGGIWVYSAKAVTLTNVEVSGNRVGYRNGQPLPVGNGGNGGGLSIDDFSNTTVTLQGTTNIHNNLAANYGGGIYMQQRGANGSIPALNILSSAAVKGNYAAVDGGGIFVSTPGPVSIAGEVSGNHANRAGGGVWSSSTNVTVTDGNFSANTAGADGGAVYFNHAAGSLKVAGASVFAGNTAADLDGDGVVDVDGVGDGGAIWVRYVSPDDNDLPSLTVSAGATFSGNTAATDSPHRNPNDNAVYAANILAPSTAWSVGADGQPLSQGYNNYDIHYSYLDTCPPGHIDLDNTTDTVGAYLVGSEQWLATALADGRPNIDITLCSDVTLTSTQAVPAGTSVTITSDFTNPVSDDANPGGGAPWSIIRGTNLKHALLSVAADASLQATRVIFDGAQVSDVDQANLNTAAGNLAAVPPTHGGAITLGSEVIVRNNINTGFNSGNFAGGIDAGKGSTIVIKDGAIITNNLGCFFGGANGAGGIAVDSDVNNPTSVLVTNGAKIINNTAGNNVDGSNCTQGRGGGIGVRGTYAQITISDGAQIIGNIAAGDGGGIQTGNNATVNITGAQTLLDNNSVLNAPPSGAGGGAIAIGSYSDLTVNGATISNNSVTCAGNCRAGGIKALAGNDTTSTKITIENNAIVTGNSTHDGAGIWTDAYAKIIIDGASVDSNVSTRDAGGIYAGANSNVELRNAASVSGNTSVRNAGGILALDNSVVTLNSASYVQGNVGAVGGIYTGTGVTVTLNDQSYVKGNTAGTNTADGGGIRTGANSAVVLNPGTSVSENTATRHGGGINLGASSALTINDATVSDNRAGQSTQGQGGGIYTAASTADARATMTLTDATISGNYAGYLADGISGTNGNTTSHGGGIYAGAYTDVEMGGNTQVVNNKALRYGGGIYADTFATVTTAGANVALVPEPEQAPQSAGPIARLVGFISALFSTAETTFDGVTIQNNTAGVSGGGIATGTDATLDLVAALVDSNTAAQTGGGIYANTRSVLTIDGTTVSNNRSGTTATNSTSVFGDGGGIYLYPGTAGDLYDATTNPVTILSLTNGSVLTNNTAGYDANNNPLYIGGGSRGGGILAGGYWTVAVAGQSEVTFNTARDSGGGIYLGNYAVLGLTDAQITNNAATNAVGGGIGSNAIPGPSAITATGSTISQNKAATNGGGIYAGQAADVQLTNSFVQANYGGVANTGNGGGIYLYSGIDADNLTELTLTNTLVADNKYGYLPADNPANDSPNNSYCAPNTGSCNGGGIGGDNFVTITLAQGSQVVRNMAVIDGGGIRVATNALVDVLSGSLVDSNIAGKRGGGIYGGIKNTITVDGAVSGGVGGVGGATISNNFAGQNNNTATLSDGFGGGIYLGTGRAATESSTLTLTNGATVSGNYAALTSSGTPVTGSNSSVLTGNGGGIFVGGYHSITISDGAQVIGNRANNAGGGISTGDITQLTVSGTALRQTLIGGNTSGGNGGGISAGNSAVLQLSGATVTGNSADNGGGLFINGTSTNPATDPPNTPASVSITDGSLVSLNTARTGGGGMYTSDSVVVTVAGSTFDSNTSVSNGGGIRLGGGGATLSLDSAAFTGNTSTYSNGGGVYAAPGYGLIDVTGSSTFTGNKAGNNGGGIWVAYTNPGLGNNELDKLYVGSAASFSGNTAVSLEHEPDADDIPIHHSNIALTAPNWSDDDPTATVGNLFDWGYNNYDISYPKDPRCPSGLYLHPDFPDANQELEQWVKDEILVSQLPMSDPQVGSYLVGTEEYLESALTDPYSPTWPTPRENLNIVLCGDIWLADSHPVPASTAVTVTSDYRSGAPYSLVRSASLTGDNPLLAVPGTSSLTTTRVIFDGAGVSDVTSAALTVDSAAASSVANPGTITLGTQTTVQNNFNTHIGVGSVSGGGVYGAEGTTVIVDDALVTGNTGTARGGGIAVDSSSASPSTVIVQNGGLITNNTATGMDNLGEPIANIRATGGGIYAGPFSTVVIDGAETLISHNSAAHNGGGIGVGVSSTVTVNSATVQNNVAAQGDEAYGGGINLREGTLSDPATLVLIDALITNNEVGYDFEGRDTTHPGDGGGIHIGANDANLTTAAYGQITITGNTEITGNMARRNGGGIATGSHSTITAQGTMVTGNQAAANGGGIYAGQASTVALTGTVVQQNYGGILANGLGGGIYLAAGTDETEQTELTLTNSQVVGNKYGFTLGDSPANDIPNDSFCVEGPQKDCDGGGIGGESNVRITLLQGATVAGNMAALNGGGIAIPDDSVIEITDDSVIAGNIAGKRGGGIFALNNNAITIDHATVTNNRSGQNISNPSGTDGSGGGIYINNWMMPDDYATTVTLTNGAVVSDNYAALDTQGLPTGITGNGGGLFIGNSNTLVLEGGSAVSDNYAANNGGGIYAANLASLITNPPSVGAALTSVVEATRSGGLETTFTYFAPGGDLLTPTPAAVRAQAYEVIGIVLAAQASDPATTSVTVSGNAAGIINAANGTGGNGGGIWLAANSTTTFTDADINSNTAGANGGGIWADASATLTIDGGAVANNLAAQTVGGFGGGIYAATSTSANPAQVMVQNGAQVTGNIVGLDLSGNPLTDSTTNTVSLGRGGGIYVGDWAQVKLLAGSAVSSNAAATQGGGINTGTNALVQVTDSVVQNNLAAQSQNGEAGGIYVFDNSTITLDNAQVTGNKVGIRADGLTPALDPAAATPTALTGDGGGIAAAQAATIHVTNGSAVTSNFAARSGGGLTVHDNSHVEITNSAVTNNLAGQWVTSADGGGINLARGTAGTPASLVLTGATITGNLVGVRGVLADGGASTGMALADANGHPVLATSPTGAVLYSTGGGIRLGNFTTLAADADTVISGNYARTNGGGIGAGTSTNAATPTTVALSVTGVSASAESAEPSDFSASSEPSASSALVTANWAGTNGGGIYLYASDATLTNLAATGNWAAQAANGAGGGVYFNSNNGANGTATLTLTNSNISSNYSGYLADGQTATGFTGNGGGIGADNYSSVLIEDGSLVTNNLAATNGGGISAGASGGTNVSLNIQSDSEISGNSAGQSGGGIWVGSGTSIEIASSEISGNYAGLTNPNYGNGGGIAATDSATVLLDDATITDNYAGYQTDGVSGTPAAQANGGGIYLAGSGNGITLQGDTEISLNRARQNGGGVSIGTGSTVTMLDSAAISGNSTGIGDGGGLWVNSTTSVAVSHSTSVSGNTTARNGGGIYLSPGYTSLVIADAAVIQNNSAPNGDGGGVWERYVSPTDNEVGLAGDPADLTAGIVISPSVTFSGNVAATVSPVRNVLDDAVYASHIGANGIMDGGGGWSVYPALPAAGGSALLQGYNNYDIAYHAAALTVMKVDGATNLDLAGAEFALYADAALTVPVPLAQVVLPVAVASVSTDGGDGENVGDPEGGLAVAGNLGVSGFAGSAGSGGSGVAVWSAGLTYGATYYLVETRAPAGYRLLAQPIEVTVSPTGAITTGAATTTSTCMVPVDSQGAVSTPVGANGSACAYAGAAALPMGNTTLLVRNYPGVALPRAGGPGSANWIWLVPTMLAALTVLAAKRGTSTPRRRLTNA